MAKTPQPKPRKKKKWSWGWLGSLIGWLFVFACGYLVWIMFLKASGKESLVCDTHAQGVSLTHFGTCKLESSP